MILEHFKGGSWGGTEVDKINRGGINEDKWLNILKPLWMPTKNRKDVYTCMTGGYDTLIDPSVVTEGFDYICFTKKFPRKPTAFRRGMNWENYFFNNFSICLYIYCYM